jgi:uncharacterized membrane protein
MNLSINSIILMVAVVLAGLSAGFFYAWQVSVIPGTKKVPDLYYLEVMQSINRAILNPSFFLVFIGSLIVLSISSIYQFNTNKWVFALMLTASCMYAIGTFGVTALGNVPLNDQLDVMNIAENGARELSEFREFYEAKWNRFHLIRTIFSVGSFILAVIALLVQSKPYNP